MVRSPCEEEDPCMVRSLWRQEELVSGPHVGVGGGHGWGWGWGWFGGSGRFLVNKFENIQVVVTCDLSCG